MKSFYLAHPFNSREKIREWELHLSGTFPVNFTNPFYSKQAIEEFQEGDVSSNEYYERLKHPSEIVENDINLINNSDGIIAIVDGSLSYGTIMEIVYAYKSGKPVYLIITNGHHKHLWFTYHATKIFTSFKEFEEFMKNG
jgi:nucleoside 2-deoxyribosyltransferase